MYVALGVNIQGRKELLGLWLNETEGAKFWLSCLTDLKNRGLKDIFIACIDGLTEFADALHTAYPDAKVQLCVVHLVRVSHFSQISVIFMLMGRLAIVRACAPAREWSRRQH